MSEDKLEKILSTYPPVEGSPGYVWFDKNHIVEFKILKEAYEEQFGKVGKIDDKDISTKE